MNEHENSVSQSNGDAAVQPDSSERFLDPEAEKYHQSLKHEIRMLDRETKDLNEEAKEKHKMYCESYHTLEAMKLAAIAALEKQFDEKLSEIADKDMELLTARSEKSDLRYELRREDRIAE